MHIGKRLYKLRKKRNVTQSEFSEGICSAEHLDDIEQGRTAAEAKLLQAFAKKYGLLDDYFLMYAVQDRTLATKLKAYYEVIHKEVMESSLAEKIYNELCSDYQQVDSLEQELHFCLLRTYQLLKQHRLSEAYAFYEEEVSPLVHHSEEIPESLKYVFYHTQALLYYFQHDYIDSYEASLKQTKYTTDEVELATCYYNAALSLFQMNTYRKVISLCKKALQLYLKTGNYAKASSTYMLKGSAFHRCDDFTKAIHYYQKALEIAKQYEVKYLIWQNYSWLGLLYFELGEYDISYEYYSLAIPLLKQYPSQSQVKVYTEFLRLLLKKEDDTEFNRVLQKVNSLCSSQNEKYWVDLVKAEYHLHQGSEDEYESLSQNAIDYLYEHRDLVDFMDFVLQLSRYFENKGQYKEACQYMKIYTHTQTYTHKREGDPPRNWSWQEESEPNVLP